MGDYSEAVHQLFIDFKKIYDSVKREEFYKSPTVLSMLEISPAD
jgi:hypothetical protein